MASLSALRGAGRFRVRHPGFVSSSPAGPVRPVPRRALSTARTSPGVLANLSAAALTVAGVAGTLFFVAYAGDSRAGVYKWVVMPLMHSLLDAEDAHRVSMRSASVGLCPKDTGTEAESVRVELFGKTLASPIGLAAGYDKNGEAVDSLLNMGFGMVEIGSVTPEPQPGNPRPRMFRLPDDGAVINRYGFNSEGHDEVLKRLRTRLQLFTYTRSRRRPSNAPPAYTHAVNKSLRDGKLLGVNLGKNKTSPEESVEDYVKGVEKFGPYADYLVVNISSPNTPGLRGLQKKEALQNLVKQVVAARNRVEERPPLLVKIAPDLSDTEIADIATVAAECDIDGIIVSNTTISRPASLRSPLSLKTQAGGLSGAPLKPLALRVVRKMYRSTGGKIPIIGCGGIYTAGDALEYARAGASAVQLYTSLGYRGPGIVREIKEGIAAKLKEQNQRWSDIVGCDAGE